jgi:hypothetical protein
LHLKLHFSGLFVCCNFADASGVTFIATVRLLNKSFDEIQDLFFAGKREEAIAAVPDDFADEISLVGPASRIKERLEHWRNSPITELLISARSPEALRQAAELVNG